MSSDDIQLMHLDKFGCNLEGMNLKSDAMHGVSCGKSLTPKSLSSQFLSDAPVLCAVLIFSMILSMSYVQDNRQLIAS